MHAITLQEATTHIATVFSDVIHGEEIVVTDRDKPVLKMIPFIMDERPRPKFGSAKGLIGELPEDVNTTSGEFAEDPLPRPQFGFLKGFFTIPDDFNEPLEDFKEYM